MVDFLPRAMGMAGWLLVAGVLPAPAGTDTSQSIVGYVTMGASSSPESYNGGFSFYSAAWPLLATNPGPNRIQCGLMGTWMFPQSNSAPTGVYSGTNGAYSDLEGGLGWWGQTTFPTATPKFEMNAVAPNFVATATGPSSGSGPGGVYGVAQLSPWLLFPMDGLNLRQGTCGQLFGYGYLALPLLPGKATTDGTQAPTGNHWWTLFLNTKSFQGPVAVVTPYYYSHTTESNTNWYGQLLDSCWGEPNKSWALESDAVPAEECADGSEGTFLRMDSMLFPANTNQNSILAHRLTVYNQTVLWNAAQQWFTNNGAAPLGPFTQGAALQNVGAGSEGYGVNEVVPLAWGSFVTPLIADPLTYGLQWATNQLTLTQTTNGSTLVEIPAYYQLNINGGTTNWVPAAVPADTQLSNFNFSSASSIPSPLTVPNDPAWTNPGPALGPFQVQLGDNSVVTYSWYRFEDQPALQNAGLTQADRDQLQAEVVKIHSAWTNGGNYLAPATVGTLADVDPALLLTPPAGLAVGYVPVASRQEWGGSVAYTWKNAASGNWSVGGNWVSNSAPLSAGQPYYAFNFSPAGTYNVTNNLNSGFALKQLSFAGAVRLSGNALSFYALPQINQNSAGSVVLSAPVNLTVPAVLGGAGSGSVVLSNVISGAGGLTVNSPGSWRLCGLPPNTYSGGTIINSGTVIWGATSNGISPDCSHALGSGPVTLNSGATLQFEMASPTNALALNGGTLHAANSAGVTWMGPVTVNSNTTVWTDYGMGISGNLSGAGGFSKTGTNTLTLSGTNTCLGPTVVQNGTLSCSQTAALGGGELSISNGALVNLNYSGNGTVSWLNLGGVDEPTGTWGSPSSPAPNQDSHFSGIGTVSVNPAIGLIGISDLPATGITTNQATLNAALGCAGASTGVYVHWNTLNGGTNAALWTNTAYLGAWTNVASTNLGYTASGLAPNTTYFFTFRGTNAAGNLWAATGLSFTTLPLPPVITGQPASITNVAGSTATFTLAASGATSYQWFKGAVALADGGNVSGAGTATLTLSGVGQPDAASYSVVVSNASTSVTSAAASLTVIPSVTLTWDANGSGAGVRDGGGAWLNSTNTWWNGSANVNWANYNSAWIGAGGAGGTITVGSVTVMRVTFTNFSGAYKLTNGSLTVVSNLTVANSAGTNVQFYTAVGGTGGVTMNSSGLLTLAGTNTYSGNTTVNAGTLVANGISAVASTTSFAVAGGATLSLSGAGTWPAVTVTGAGTVRLLLGGGANVGVNGNLSGFTGILDLTNGMLAVTPYYSPSFASPTNGTIKVENNTTLYLGWQGFSLHSTVELYGGNDNGEGYGVLRGDTAQLYDELILGANSTIGSAGGTFAIYAVISDGGLGYGFSEVASGTVVLAATNTYSGPTVVKSGTLQCNYPGALGTGGALSLSNGTVLNLNYPGTHVASALTLGGTNLPPGVYGSSSSPATNPDAHFSGTGTVTVTPIYIANTPATALTSSAAALHATFWCLTNPAAVFVYWNTVNGGTNALLWTNSAFVGAWTNLSATNLSYTATGLLPGTAYNFAFCATNLEGALWASNVQAFTTLALPPVPVLPVSGVRLSNGVPTFSFTAAGGVKYRLDYKNALTDTVWSYDPWSTNPSGSAQSMILSDPTNAAQPQRFYRLEAAYP